VAEAAGADERIVDRRDIVPALVQSVANGVEFTERGKELECARKEALAVKQLQQALRADAKITLQNW